MAAPLTRLLFGTGGVPETVPPPRTTEGAIERLRQVGLGAMEVEFVRRVAMGPAAARAVARVADKAGVRLSVHAPYAVNLNAKEPEKVRASQDRLLLAARIAHLLGAETVNFHPAFYLNGDPRQVYQVVKVRLQEVVRQLRQDRISVRLRPEIMGKHSQFGTFEELLSLAQDVEGVLPTLDVAHWHARTGRVNSYDEFEDMLRQVERRLGRAALDDMHFHCSGIKYSKAGELSHLKLKESDFNYVDFLRAVKALEVKGMVICESPDLEGDALLLQQTYLEL
ncbi:MAG: TIM barrel protein [Chloroflexi bacterium]|nr:TIM barrel protein [Chloroflexota bacterium]